MNSVSFLFRQSISSLTIRTCGRTFRIQILKLSNSISMIGRNGYQLFMIQMTLKSIQESLIKRKTKIQIWLLLKPQLSQKEKKEGKRRRGISYWWKKIVWDEIQRRFHVTIYQFLWSKGYGTPSWREIDRKDQSQNLQRSRNCNKIGAFISEFEC